MIFVREVIVCILRDKIMERKIGVILSFIGLGTVWLRSFPWLCSLLVGLGLCLVHMGSWKNIHIALHTVKRDLM